MRGATPGLTSVITVNFDTGGLLAAAARSVLESTAPVELLVVDNASTDDSLERAAGGGRGRRAAARLRERGEPRLREGEQPGAGGGPRGVAAAPQPRLRDPARDDRADAGGPGALSRRGARGLPHPQPRRDASRPAADGRRPRPARRSCAPSASAASCATSASREARLATSSAPATRSRRSRSRWTRSPARSCSRAGERSRRSARSTRGTSSTARTSTGASAFGGAASRSSSFPARRRFTTRGRAAAARPVRVLFHLHRGMVRFYRKFFRDAVPVAAVLAGAGGGVAAVRVARRRRGRQARDRPCPRALTLSRRARGLGSRRRRCVVVTGATGLVGHYLLPLLDGARLRGPGDQPPASRSRRTIGDGARGPLAGAGPGRLRRPRPRAAGGSRGAFGSGRLARARGSDLAAAAVAVPRRPRRACSRRRGRSARRAGSRSRARAARGSARPRGGSTEAEECRRETPAASGGSAGRSCARRSSTAAGRDRNVSAIARFVTRFGFFPIAGEAARAGGSRSTPPTWPAAALAVLDNPATFDRAYDTPGGETLTYAEMVVPDRARCRPDAAAPVTCRCPSSAARSPRRAGSPGLGRRHARHGRPHERGPGVRRPRGPPGLRLGPAAVPLSSRVGRRG